MCNFWTCLITRKGKVIWDKKTNSHEDLVKKGKLEDSKLKDRDFVRIEITPKKPELILSKKKTDWELKVDEEKTLPEWFTNNRGNYETKCRKGWEKAMKVTLWKLDLTEAVKTIKEIKKIKYFSLCGKPKKEWKLFTASTWGAARDAAWGAARDAAGDAAWGAARDAAWGAARDAAGDAAWGAAGGAAGGAARDAAGGAARDAAWDAAGGAAGDAAWDAAGDAAWDAAGGAAGDAALDAKLLCYCRLSRIKGKHLKHAEDRMEVWKRGYGLRCDVSGVLYVYGIRKEEVFGGKEK